MKKLLTILSCLLFLFSFSATVSAADTTATLSGLPEELRQDGTATVSVTANVAETVTSALIRITLDDGLTLVSGQWEIDGELSDFNLQQQYGVIMPKSKSLKGLVFRFVIKGKAASQIAQKVKVQFTLQNGSASAGTASAEASVKVLCATHSYGEYTKKNGESHTRTCAKCGYMETSAHSWDDGEVRVEATCTETGSTTYTCTADGCGAKVIRKTPAKGHNYGKAVVVTPATTLAAGKRIRTCTVCGNVQEEIIPKLDVAATDKTDNDEPEPDDSDEIEETNVDKTDTPDFDKADDGDSGEATAPDSGEVTTPDDEETVSAYNDTDTPDDGTEAIVSDSTDTTSSGSADENANTGADENAKSGGMGLWWIWVLLAVVIAWGDVFFLLYRRKRR